MQGDANNHQGMNYWGQV